MVKDKFELEEDEDLCACCLDGTVYEDNEILLCDKCDVPVHQSCYGIKTVPDEDWFCNICRLGLNPNNIKCELCSFTGGAYKPTTCGKWVHVLCASWIPEIFCTNTDNMEPFDITGLDKRRFGLKCTVCKTKGACVQCSYGRCSTAAHPRCALADPNSGYTHRIIKNNDGGSDWEIFCKQHADAVKEAAKPKKNWGGGYPNTKKSSTKTAEDSDDHGNNVEEINEQTKKGSSKKKVTNKSKHSNPGSDSEFNDELSDNNDYDDEPPPKSRGRPRGSAKDKGDYALAAEAVFDHEYWCKVYADTQLDLEEKTSKEPDIKQKIFKVLTMSEWPGQNEGEAMDLMHYWSFISMAFAEDHSKEWVDYMCAPLRNINDDSPEMFVPPVPAVDKEVSTELIKKTDAILSSYTERDRNGIFDPDVRDNFLSLLNAYAEQLRTEVNGNEILERSLLDDTILREQKEEREQRELEEGAATKLDVETIEHDDSLGKSRKDRRGRPKFRSSGSRDSLSARRESRDSLSTMVPAALANKKGPDDEVEEESTATRVFIHDKNQSGSLYSCAKSYLTEKVNEAETTTLSSYDVKVLFDGPNRHSCTFKVDVDGKQSADGWTSVLLDPDSLKDHREWANSHLIGSSPSPTSAAPSHLEKASIKLNDYKEFSRDSVVEVGNRTLIARSDDDSIRRMLMTDQKIYKGLMNSIKYRMDSLLRNTIYERVANRTKEGTDWQDIENAYIKQRVWCKIGHSIYQGMRDQKNDFNVHAPEEVPASWAIQVDGRPAPTAPEDTVDPEDAVCMVCFDGNSCDANQILFCDGCNASLHQTCYGITEIPEGDFFCDRCQAVQWFASECDDWYYHFCKDAVSCALCPLYHGGLKPTTDGRWVHLCCAIWSHSPVKNLDEMMPVDITAVEKAPIGSTCLYCQQSSGYLMSCCGKEEDGQVCKAMFHPLCAWFNGNYLETTITDPAFKNYPEGLHFRFTCGKHCPSEHAGEDLRNLQVKLRTKYKILEEDLEGIPGKNKKKRKNKKKERPVTTGRGGTSNVKKDLRDKPDPNVCAICVTSTQKCHMDVVEIDDPIRTCVSCQVTIHGHCDPYPYEAGLVTVEEEVAPDAIAHREEDGSIKVWKCAMCVADVVTDPNCVACPRKGGYFRPTVDGQWIHAFCAKHCPGNITIAEDNEVHIKAIPKQFRKKNCIVCNRGNRGWIVSCQVEGCPNVFHPLCAERNHVGFLRVRNGVKTAYCAEHVPPDVKRLPSGGWLDVNEVQMLRFTVDKARLILDVVRKREKTRKVIWNTEGELFTCKFNRLLKAYRSKKLGEVTTLTVGMMLCGPGIVAGTTIVSIKEEGVVYLLSNPLETTSSEDAMEIVACQNNECIENEVKEEPLTPPKTEPSPSKTSNIVSGAIVQSIYGKGVVKSIRSDGMCIIEASNWLLADNKAPFFYMLSDTLVPAETVTPRKARENATITAMGENGIELLVNASIEGAVMTVTAVHMKDTVEDILMDTSVFRDAEDEKLFENFFVEQEAQSKSKKKEKTKKQRASTGKVGWENFTELPCGETVAISTRRYDSIEISSTWLDRTKRRVEIPDRIMVSLAGLELVQSDATMCSRSKEYIMNVKERMDRQIESTGGYPNEDSIFKVKLDKFSKDLDKETKKIVHLNDKDFKIWKMNHLDPIMQQYAIPEAKEKKRKAGRPASEAVAVSPSYLDPSTMTEVDLFNYTFSSLDNEENIGFDMELHTAGLTVDDGDWGWANTVELKMRVERIIQDILSVVENFRCPRNFNNEPTIPKEGNIFVDRMKEGMQGKLLKTQRMLAGDFKEIPYDQIPDYNSLVKTPLSTTILGEKLSNHLYYSLNVFSMDFYEMLNNGRSLSPEGSQVHSDTHYIALLFEKAKEDAKKLGPEIPITQSGFQTIQRPLNATKDAEGEYDHSSQPIHSEAPSAPIRCGCCLEKFLVAGWPSSAYFPSNGACTLAEPQIEPLTVRGYMEAAMEEGKLEALPTKDEEKVYSSYVRTVDSARKHPLQWLCKGCIVARATSTILGKVVKVWWHDDSEYYSGVVDHYEASSGRHRVKYFDGMWEFVDLRAEPFLITYPYLKKMDEIIEDPEEPIFTPPLKKGRKHGDDYNASSSTPRARAPSSKVAENVELGMYDSKSPSNSTGGTIKKGKPGRPRKRPRSEDEEQHNQTYGTDDNSVDIEYMGKKVCEMSANELREYLNNLGISSASLSKAEKVSLLENIACIDMDTIYSLSYEGEIIDDMNASMLKNFMLVLQINGRMTKDEMRAQLTSVATSEIYEIEFRGKNLVKHSKEEIKKIFTDLNLPKVNDKKDDLMLALGEYLKRIAVFA